MLRANWGSKKKVIDKKLGFPTFHKYTSQNKEKFNSLCIINEKCSIKNEFNSFSIKEQHYEPTIQDQLKSFSIDEYPPSTTFNYQ